MPSKKVQKKKVQAAGCTVFWKKHPFYAAVIYAIIFFIVTITMDILLFKKGFSRVIENAAGSIAFGGIYSWIMNWKKKC
jgi:hypothetical protein